MSIIRQIKQLLTEAVEHGDTEQVEICRRAIDGDEASLAICLRVIKDAEAQQD